MSPNKLEASEAITLGQPSQHLAGLCSQYLSSPGAHTPAVAAKYPSGWALCLDSSPLPNTLLDELIQTYLPGLLARTPLDCPLSPSASYPGVLLGILRVTEDPPLPQPQTGLQRASGLPGQLHLCVGCSLAWGKPFPAIIHLPPVRSYLHSDTTSSKKLSRSFPGTVNLQPYAAV